MSQPCIISVAITGSLPRKKDNPAVPITVAEQIESTHEAFEAGAALVHLHVRNDDETPTSAPERFAQVLDGIRKHCPGMITQVSTGGRSGAGIGRDQLTVAKWSMELGGHCRTGLEDNVRLDKHTLASSNAALVRQVAALCGEYARRPATPWEARRLLNLPFVDALQLAGVSS